MAWLWRSPAPPPPPPGAETVRIWALDTGFHTDLLLPLDRVRARGGPAAATTGDAAGDWLMAGWGDSRFYRGAGWSPSRHADAVAAALWPTAAVLMARVDHGDPAARYERAVPVDLTPEGFEALMRELDAAFVVEAGRLVPLPDLEGRPYPFYAAHGGFHLFHHCNHWAADLLRTGGVSVRPLLAGLPSGLGMDLRARRAALDSAAASR